MWQCVCMCGGGLKHANLNTLSDNNYNKEFSPAPTVLNVLYIHVHMHDGAYTILR